MNRIYIRWDYKDFEQNIRKTKEESIKEFSNGNKLLKCVISTERKDYFRCEIWNKEMIELAQENTQYQLHDITLKKFNNNVVVVINDMTAINKDKEEKEEEKIFNDDFSFLDDLDLESGK